VKRTYVVTWKNRKTLSWYISCLCRWLGVFGVAVIGSGAIWLLEKSFSPPKSGGLFGCELLGVSFHFTSRHSLLIVLQSKSKSWFRLKGV